MELEKIQNSQYLEFLGHFQRGTLCVHPTDTIPGLTFDPRQSAAFEALNQIKKRGQKKSFVSLVPSFDKALSSWQNLPDFWVEILSHSWPEFVTFTWKGRENLPTVLLSETGELALRCPRLDKESDWFRKFLLEAETLIPSTSINQQGEPALLERAEIERFCAAKGIYVPELLSIQKNKLPSSVIRILGEGTFEFLRVGAVSEKEFEKFLRAVRQG